MRRTRSCCIRSGVLLGSLIAAALSSAVFAAATDWPSVHQNLAGQRYSTLDQLTPANVANLQVAWTYHMRPVSAAGAPVRLQLSEATPLVVGQTMYVATPYGSIVALDASTGAERWSFVIPGDDRASLRGVAYWPGGGGAPAAIMFGTRGGKLISVDAATGVASTGFGMAGVVDLKTPAVMTTGLDQSYILPSPPIVWKNLVITGAGPGEGPGGIGGGSGPAGDTRAWDARTGKLVWTFHSVPRPGEFGFDSWGGGSAKDRSGVNVWGYMTIDAERGILYMPFGAPNNDRVGTDRPGNNLFSSSVVAVHADTGKYIWHFQIVHHDIWDMDTASPPTLFDVHRGGRVIPAVASVNKNALMFVLDRVTGKPVFGVEERPVQASDVPGEQVSPTQPFPLLPEPLAQNTLSRDKLYKGIAAHQQFCERLVDDNNMLLGNEPYIPTRLDRYTVSLPGTQGGVNYYGGAVDPKQRLFVVNVNNLAQPMRIVRGPDGGYVNSGPLAGLVRFWDPATHLPCGPTPWGQLVAVDIDTGKIAWRTTLGVTDSFPEGQQHTGRPGLGGAIVTGGGLVFVGSTDDARLRAFETRTGREVWTYKLPASAEATPVTYAARDGSQLVAIVATGGGLIGAKLESDVVMAFSLKGAGPVVANVAAK